MKILVVGSFRDQSDENLNDFRSACRALGSVLARQNHRVILCSTSESTADRYVLEGMDQTAEVARVIFYRLDRGLADPLADRVTAELFGSLNNVEIDQRYVDGGWRVVHLKSINEADLVISLAGTERGTGTVIYSAEALGKPVFVVPIFGGASEHAWRDFKRFYTSEEVAVLQRPWRESGTWAGELLDAAVDFARRNPIAKVRASDAVSSVIVSLSLVVGWIAALLRVDGGLIPPLVWAYAMILFATYLGVMLRHSIASGRYDWRRRLYDFFQAILVSFAVFILAEGVNVFVTDKGILLDRESVRLVGWRLSVIGFFGGFLLDEYIKSLEKRARKALEG